MNSVPAIEKKGTPASPAIAFARRVLPVPGGPTNKTPAGDLAPSFRNRDGSLRKDTTSVISDFTWSMPAISSNVILASFEEMASIFAPPKILSLFFFRPMRNANLMSRNENHTGNMSLIKEWTTGRAGFGSEGSI